MKWWSIMLQNQAKTIVMFSIKVIDKTFLASLSWQPFSVS